MTREVVAYSLLALGVVIIAIAWYHFFRVLDCRPAGVTWSQLLRRPALLTDEGRHHLRVFIRFFVAAMAMLLLAAWLAPA